MKKIWAVLLLTVAAEILSFPQEVCSAKNVEKSVTSDSDSCQSGIVGLKVTFEAGGEVTNVTPIAELPCGLTEQAIEAAKRIEFKPEKKNGIPVTVIKTVEYKFSILVDEKAEAIMQKAVQRLGGENYLNVKTIIGRGNFSRISENEGSVVSEFIDYIVYPDKERIEFKSNGVRTIQTNLENIGWIADTAARTIKDQTPEQIADFKAGIRTSLDYFLRGGWKQEKGARLEYVGRRPASLGQRNEVVRLVYADGTQVEFEFAATDGTPAKSIYKRQNDAGETVTEEDRFAQFVEFNRVYAPLIVEHYRNGKQTSRINYQSIEFNAQVAEALFAKPSDIKKLK